MKKIYLDNAATTALDKEVFDAMQPYMLNHYGNPSSIHEFGRETRKAIESARNTIAELLSVSPNEIFFTSGGTEANNMAIRCTIEGNSITHAISSPLEHHAVGHTLESLAHQGKITLNMTAIKPDGHIDLDHLEILLAKNPRSFVSLMHANNEIGNLSPIEKIAQICQKYNAIFHSDTVQTIGHYPINLKDIKADLISCSAHKLHGPKGVGFIYISNKINIPPLITGGSQERNMRGGTENLYGIIGLSMALTIAYRDMRDHQAHILRLKQHMIKETEKRISGICFNGDAKKDSLYTVLNICFPATVQQDMLHYLESNGISASAGSACNSGSAGGSHVLRSIGSDMARPSVRFSFSKNNTMNEINHTLDILERLAKKI